MMKHARANNLVERLAKLPDPLDRKPVELQISYVVPLLKIPGVAQACFADVDRSDTRVRLHERMTRGLRRTAASDKDGSIGTRLFQRPQQQRLRAPPLRIAVAIEALLESGDRRRIRMRLVERANRLGAIGGRFRVLNRCWHPLCSLSSHAIGEAEPPRKAVLTGNRTETIEIRLSDHS
jgi:hypothetical protein